MLQQSIASLRRGDFHSRADRQAQRVEHRAMATFSRKWERMEQIVLYNEVQELFTRAVCSRAGIPLEEPSGTQRTREIREEKDKDRKNLRMILSA